MARRAMITPLTMYKIDNTIFDGITLPIYNFPRSSEYPDLFLYGWNMDKETFINNLLLETAELDTLYTEPDYFKFAVTQWSHKEFPIWQKLYETLFYKYNPIWNKDGTIKENANEIRNMINNENRIKSASSTGGSSENENINDTDNTNNIHIETGEESKTNSGNKSITDNKTSTGTENENTNNSKTIADDTTQTNKISAFDASTFADREQTIIDKDTTERENNINNKISINTESGNSSELNSINENTNNIVTSNDTNIRDYNRGRKVTNSNNTTNNENENVINTDNGTIDNVLTRIEQGNIGVTTTQQMIEAERELVKFNIYDFIIDSFKARFCLLIY